MKKQVDQSTTTTVVADERAVADERLTAEEERILRMRSGASLPGTAALDNKLEPVMGPARREVAARLRLIEAELLATHAGRDAAAAPDPDPGSIAGSDSGLEAGVESGPGRKARIIAALRDKSEE